MAAVSSSFLSRAFSAFSCSFLPGPFSLLRLLVLLLLLNLELLELVRHAIAVYPHQHLLLHRQLVLSLELLDGWLVLRVVLAELLDVVQELVLLLPDALVVQPVEVSLLAELVPRGLSLVRHLLGVLELALERHHRAVQLLVRVVHVGDLGHALHVEPAGGLQLVPLRLELLQRRRHAHLDQEIANEVVHHLRSR
jgi:hypothetical protein